MRSEPKLFDDAKQRRVYGPQYQYISPFSGSKQDDEESRPMATLLLDQDLVGKSYARNHGKDGETTRTEILEIIKEEHDARYANHKHVRMRVKMGDDVFEELVAYNEVLEFIEDDYHVDDDIYEVLVKICDHFMPQVQLLPEGTRTL